LIASPDGAIEHVNPAAAILLARRWTVVRQESRLFITTAVNYTRGDQTLGLLPPRAAAAAPLHQMAGACLLQA
jgi:hypothetical protein